MNNHSEPNASATTDAPKVWALVPAFNEADRIRATISALRSRPEIHCIVVVDDGSTDDTAKIAVAAGANKVLTQKNQGKGTALATAYAVTPEDVDIILLLDSDLGASASEAVKLLRPLMHDEADMAIGMLPPDPDFAAAGKSGGTGIVVRLANWGIHRATGRRFRQPLSGQRAIRRSALEKSGAKFASGYGVEVALTIAVLRAGLRIVEVETHFRHKVTASDVGGILHRTRQLVHVARALAAGPVAPAMDSKGPG